MEPKNLNKNMLKSTVALACSFIQQTLIEHSLCDRYSNKTKPPKIPALKLTFW